METKELNDLYGLSEDESQQEVVDPAQETVTDEGTDYVSLDEEVTPEDYGESSEAEETENPEDTSVEEVAAPQQSPEENHSYAAARKEAEAQARQYQEQMQAQQAELAAMKKALLQFGYEGTGQEIADLLDANRTGREVSEVAAERMAAENALQEAISNHPDVQQARQMMKEITEEKTKNQIDAELRNINAINPDIKTLEDLSKIPNKRAFDALIKDGVHIDEAYKIVTNFGEKKSSTPKQDTKSHLKQVNGASSNGGPGTMPADVYAFAKAMMPDASKADIIRYYEKNYK